MSRKWSVLVDAEQGEDRLFVSVLMLFAPDEESLARVQLHGVYRTALEAVEAGRRAIRAMGSES